jgi:hypothetical protein
MRGALVALMATAIVLGAASFASARPLKTFGDGTHRISASDVPAGTYRSTGGDGCYWERLKNFSGDLSSILANDNAAGPAVVTILPGDKGFSSNECGTWTSSLKRITRSTTTFGEGTYIVGVDIAPGTYQSKGGDGCYWARERAFTGGLTSILANDNPTGQAIVTIKAGDRGFTSNGCAAWRRF